MLLRFALLTIGLIGLFVAAYFASLPVNHEYWSYNLILLALVALLLLAFLLSLFIHVVASAGKRIESRYLPTEPKIYRARTLDE